MEPPSPSPPTLLTKDGVVVSLLEAAAWSHVVYVDRETGALLVPPDAFFEHVDPEMLPISKGQSQRQDLREKLFTIGSNVRVTFEKESRIVRQAVRGGKIRQVVNADHVVLHRSKVVLSPEDYAPTRKCWTDHFGEIGLSDHFAEQLHRYQENVLYEGDVRVDVALEMTADGICSGVECAYSLWGICKVRRFNSRNATEVDIISSDTRHEFVRQAPWNRDWRDSRQPLAAAHYDSDDDDYVPRVTSRPLKDYELIEGVYGFIVDHEVKRAFSPALPDQTVLLAESNAQREDRYYLGRWIKMDVYFSRIRDAWIAIEYHAERMNRAERGVPVQESFSGEPPAFRLKICKSAYDGYYECVELTQHSRLKYLKKPKLVQILAADPLELLVSMARDELLVWARLANVGSTAHFIVESIAEEEEADLPYVEEMASESGIYLGGAERVIFCKKRPFTRFILAWCFDDQIQPGANIRFLAVLDAHSREYVAVRVESLGRQALQVVQSSAGPAMKVLLRPRENREYMWLSSDVNCVEDPNHVLGSDDGSTHADGRNAWIIPHPSRADGAAFFIVHSQDRPQKAAVEHAIQLEDRQALCETMRFGLQELLKRLETSGIENSELRRKIVALL